MAKASRQNDPEDLIVERQYTITDEQLKSVVEEVFHANIPRLKDEIYSEMKKDGKIFIGTFMIEQGFKFFCYIVGTATLVFLSICIKFGWIKVG